VGRQPVTGPIRADVDHVHDNNEAIPGVQLSVYTEQSFLRVTVCGKRSLRLLEGRFAFCSTVLEHGASFFLKQN
jgi:hypothetical protein